MAGLGVPARPPRLSVGLAVYNGADYVAAAIESILAQTYRDFELIICDNASTDGTGEICRGYAARDPRIRYHRNPRNIGGVNNETLTMELARGELFRLAAHDDICEPTLFERCVAVLDETPDAVLAYSSTIKIDEDGEVIGELPIGKGTSPDPWVRFGDFPFRDHDSEVTYGVVRTDVLRRVHPQGAYGHSDRVWLAELAMQGRFVAVPEPLFRKRYHGKNAYVDIRARILWFRPDWSGRFSMPYWHELVDYLRVIEQAPVPVASKLRCAPVVVRWALRHSPNLAKDLGVAVVTGLGVRKLRSSPDLNWA